MHVYLKWKIQIIFIYKSQRAIPTTHRFQFYNIMRNLDIIKNIFSLKLKDSCSCVCVSPSLSSLRFVRGEFEAGKGQEVADARIKVGGGREKSDGDEDSRHWRKNNGKLGLARRCLLLVNL